MTTATSAVDLARSSLQYDHITVGIDQPPPTVRAWLDYHVGQEWAKPIGSAGRGTTSRANSSLSACGRELICGVASLFDGYIAGATAFFDANKNGVLRGPWTSIEDGIQDTGRRSGPRWPPRPGSTG